VEYSAGNTVIVTDTVMKFTSVIQSERQYTTKTNQHNIISGQSI